MVSRIIKILICIVTVKMVCVQNVLSSDDTAQSGGFYYTPNTGIPLMRELVAVTDDHDGNATVRPDMTVLGFSGLNCDCTGFRCSCCAGIKMDVINLDKKACMNFNYIPTNIGINMSLHWNDGEVYNNQISLRNPPVMCISPPDFLNVIFCARIADVSMVNNKLRFCINFDTSLYKTTALVLRFKCLEIGTDGFHSTDVHAPLTRPGSEDLIIADQYEVSFYEPQTGIPFLGELTREIVYYGGNATYVPGLAIYGLNGLSCKCSGFDCSCCAGIKIKKYNIDKTACFKFTYLPTDIAMKMSLLWNDKEIYSKQVSVRDPPPVCLSIPYVPSAKFCVRFSEVSIRNNVLRTCIDFEVHVASTRILKLHFKCVEIGSKGLFWDSGSCPYALISQQETEQFGAYNEVLLELLDQEPLLGDASKTTLPPK